MIQENSYFFEYRKNSCFVPCRRYVQEESLKNLYISRFPKAVHNENIAGKPSTGPTQRVFSQHFDNCHKECDYLLKRILFLQNSYFKVMIIAIS